MTTGPNTQKLVLNMEQVFGSGPVHPRLRSVPDNRDSGETLPPADGGRLTVAKVNIDENNRKAAEFGVRAIPTLLLFRDGKPVQTLVGVQTKSALKTTIDTHLA